MWSLGTLICRFACSGFLGRAVFFARFSFGGVAGAGSWRVGGGRAVFAAVIGGHWKGRVGPWV